GQAGADWGYPARADPVQMGMAHKSLETWGVFFSVRIVIREMDFIKARDDDETANLIWNDSAVQHEKIAELRNYQRINHFPGMGEICRKDCLARNMSKMIKCQPQEYSFIPKTWIFPAEYTQFQNYVKELRRKRKQKTFIVKPANGAMGHGISLIRNCEKLPAQEHFIVQEYLDKPFLMEGYKFDLRIYILVTSCDPLRIFLYNDGLVRMGTEKYHAPSEANLSQLYMHLTNYSVNKHNENFERDETVDKGSKRSISWFTEFLRTSDYDVAKFWGDISELVVKTLIVAEPHVLHAYRMCRPGQPPGSDSVCFEVLGFDIILDRKLKPWLLEINRAPSFGTDQKIDYDVKKGVLLNALKLLNIRYSSDKKRNLAQQKAEAQRRLYGHGSMKKLSASSSDWEKQRHTLERRKEELKERLAQVRKQISREEHENLHLGNYRRIYPPDDKLLLEKYESLLSAAFQTFLAGRAASLQKEMNNPLKRMKEEDILDLLEQCELDDEKLMGKSSKQRGPKVGAQRRLRSEKSFSLSSDTLSPYCLFFSTGRMHWKPPIKIKPSTAQSMPPTISGPIRRSISCPRSIASLSSPSEVRVLSTRPSPTFPLVPPLTRQSSGKLRSHSLSRSGSAHRVPHSSSLGTIQSIIGDPLLNLRSKEQEAELVRQTLLALNTMRIRFPGKTEEEAEAVILTPRLTLTRFLCQVLDIVRTNVLLMLQRIWREPSVDTLHLYRLFNRVFNRLLWSHGQGLWNCFSNTSSSWEAIFNKSSEVVSPQELLCCRRLVQLCRDCLLVVYKFVSESRGSLTGLSPEWDDTR
uniref:Tubulin tyrosine ligase like 7 n=1 Tax=Nothobranchius furzeri TaxID=105023 RepID=A0A8C6M6H4_NOTFU